MIWLIGNKGMLGSDIEAVLRSGGMDYTATDREVDITDSKVLAEFTEKNSSINWIINCSAYTAVDKAEDESELCYKINSDGVRNIAAAAKKIGAKLIHISTDYVFDGKSSAPLSETAEAKPVSVYGKSKLSGENEIRSGYDKHFIIRTAWLYGKNGNNFVYTMLRLFNERDEVKVVSDQRGTPTYAADLAKLVVEIIRSDSSDFGTYHFTNEGDINWYDFAVEIYRQGKISNLVKKDTKITPITTAEYPTKAVRPAYSLLDKSKVKKTFNFSIRDWQSGLSDFMDEIVKVQKTTP